MSWLGYEQNICENGHYTTDDSYCGSDGVCPICQAKIAWFNVVDCTNPPGPQGEIPMEALQQFIIKEEVIETCPTCQHSKELSPTIYRVPSREETDPLRVYLEEVQDFDPNDDGEGQ
jgi:hypothetical protein